MQPYTAKRQEPSSCVTSGRKLSAAEFEQPWTQTGPHVPSSAVATESYVVDCGMVQPYETSTQPPPSIVASER